MDKLLFSKPRRQTDKSCVIRISAEVYNVLSDLRDETGLSVSYIANKMIEFAAEHTEVIED